MKKNSLTWIYPSIIMGMLLMFTISSNKKDDSNNSSRKELLMSRQWKLFSIKINGVAQVMPNCSKDDFMTFGRNGILTLNPGTIKCDSSDEIETGSWNLSSDENRIIVTTVKDEVFEHVIVELTEIKLVISLRFKDGVEDSEMTYIAF
jgi:hypothetical protein